MNQRSNAPHLRVIISASQKTEGAKSKLRSETQLAFPYPESSTIFFVFIDAIGHREFTRIVKEYVPRWVIDVRTVPRLDTIASSRSSAFDLFRRSKIIYVDLFGRLGITSYRSADSNPTFWINTLLDLIGSTEVRGPYLLLFDNRELMIAAEKTLQGRIEPIVGKRTNFAHIP